MPYIDLDTVRLHYRRDGPKAESAPPLLLIAGMTSDSASWQPILPALAEHYDVIAPDNRCTGLTLPSPVANSRDSMLDDLCGLLDALEITEITVVGHSMGAMLGWALAARSTARVKALVAMSGLPEIMPVRIDFFATLSRLRVSSTPEDWYRLLFHALFSPAFFEEPARVEAAIIGALAYPHRQTAEALIAQTDALHTFIDTPPIDQISCPVLTVTGELDVLMTPSMVSARFSDMPEIEQASISAAAHALHWEQPEPVASLIVSYLSRQGHMSVLENRAP